MAAAGLAVSLLTQGVGEVVISGTWRRRARRSDRKIVDISISVELSYVPHCLMAIFYVSPPRGPDIQMSQSFGTVSVLLWKCQCYSELCDWGHGALLPLCKTLHLQNAHF